MIKNSIFYPRKENFGFNRAILRSFFLVLIVFLTTISLVSAADWDNIKGYEEEVGDYGKITIRNSVLGIPFLQLDKVIELELEENSDVCEGLECNAGIPIVLYEDGVLIDGIRFLHTEKDGTQYYDNLNYQLYLRTDQTKTVDDYEVQCVKGEYVDEVSYEENKTQYIKEGYYKQDCRSVKVGSHQENILEEYKLGEEAKAGTYYLEIDATLPDMWTTIDWQIRSNGYWLEEWAVWTSSLNGDLLAYYDMTNITSTLIPDLTRNGFDIQVLSINGIPKEKVGIIGTGQGDFTNVNTQLNMTGSPYQFSNRSFSMAFWVNLSGICGNAGNIHYFFDSGRTRLNLEKVVGNCEFTFNLDNTPVIKTDGINLTDNLFHQLGFNINSTGGVALFYDGVLNITSPTSISGTISTNISDFETNSALPINYTFDEVGLWNRTLTEAEFSDLYNSGAALQFPNVNVTLNSPINDSIIISGNIGFNASVDVIISGNRITNVTLYIWNSTNLDNFTTNFTLETGDFENFTYNLSANLLIADNYTWNYFGCSNITIGDPCGWAGENRTFNMVNFVENTITFNNDTKEGTSETFILNLTTSPSTTINDITFVYNNTNISVNLVTTNGNHIATSTTDSPLVTVKTNVSFHWLLNFNTQVVNSTFNNQTVDPLNIDDCSSFADSLLNLTLRDETNQTILSSAEDLTTIDVDIDLSAFGSTTINPIVEFNKTFSQVNPARVCLDGINASRYRMDAVIRYESNTRVSEFYHIQNFTVDNSTIPQNISLFDLNLTAATSFKIRFKDDNFLPVENALIDITRKYIGEGVFKTVELPKTDNLGETGASLIIDDVIYTFIVSKNGQILATFEERIAQCDNVLIGDCVINLNELTTETNPANFSQSSGVSYSFNFDDSTNTIDVLFSTTGGGVKNVTVLTTVFDRFGNTSVCSDTLISSSGTLTCNIPTTFGNQTVISRLLIDNEKVTQKTFAIDESPVERWGEDTLGTVTIMFFLFVISLPLMFMVDKRIMLIVSVVSFVTASSLFLYSGGGLFETSGVVIWLIVAVAIIIWRLSQNSEL